MIRSGKPPVCRRRKALDALAKEVEEAGLYFPPQPKEELEPQGESRFQRLRKRFLRPLGEQRQEAMRQTRGRRDASSFLLHTHFALRT